MTEEKPKKVIRMSDIMPPVEKQKEEEEKFELEVEPEVEPEEEVAQPEILEVTEPEKVEMPIEEEERVFPEDLFTPKPRKRKKKVLVIVGSICLIVFAFIFYFTLSKAEVIINPKIETMQFQTELSIDKNVAFIDLENNKIPGQLFQVEEERQKEFLATKEKELREKARGTITVYNQYSSAPQTLVKNTRFVSEKGKLFRTTQTIVISGAKVKEGQIIPSSVDVGVMAAEPGKEYNIGPSSFTIPGFKDTAKYTGFYGKSTGAMTGGIVGKVKVVSGDDIQGAKDILFVELKEKTRKELEKRIPSDLKILEGTILEEVIESSSSVEADQPAEKFTVKVKVAAKILGFDENDAVSLINDSLKGKISENRVLVPDTIELNYTITDINLERGTVKLACEVRENVAWKIDAEEIRRELAGKNEIKVRQYLASRPEIESAKVIFWPFWVKKIPSNEEKIKITVASSGRVD